MENKLNSVTQDCYSKQLLKLAQQAAASDASVLISGESGVGKEMIAQYIHSHSLRARKPFITVHCAAVPKAMLETILFGCEKDIGAATAKNCAGKFEQAQQGTLLLDEVAEIPLALQAKLLKVLQQKAVKRLGSRTSIALDTRIISITHQNLQQQIVNGKFRKDLYYCLNDFPLHWIPLRERPLDIIVLAEYLIDFHCQSMQRTPPVLSDRAKHHLLQYHWPGNAREMDNVIRRSLTAQTGGTLDIPDLILGDRTK